MPRKTNPDGGTSGRAMLDGDGVRPSTRHSSTGRPRSQTRRRYVRAADGRFVAYVQGDELHADRHGSRQFLRVPPAIAFDQVALDEARALGARVAVVVDKDTGTRYLAPLDEFERHGLRISRGAGPQTALALVYWRAERADGPQQLALV